MGTRQERRAGSRQRAQRRTPRRWVETVTSLSTKTPPGLFTRDAATIARTLTLPRVSPRGPVSGFRMLSFFINRAGRQLTRSRRAELENAKRLMRKTIETERARP